MFHRIFLLVELLSIKYIIKTGEVRVNGPNMSLTCKRSGDGLACTGCSPRSTKFGDVQCDHNLGQRPPKTQDPLREIKTRYFRSESAGLPACFVDCFG